jgi:hypothetical protein
MPIGSGTAKGVACVGSHTDLRSLIAAGDMGKQQGSRWATETTGRSYICVGRRGKVCGIVLRSRRVYFWGARAGRCRLTRLNDEEEGIIRRDEMRENEIDDGRDHRGTPTGEMGEWQCGGRHAEGHTC